MSVEFFLTLGVLGAAFALLILALLSADAVLLGGLVGGVLGDVISLERDLDWSAFPGLLHVAVAGPSGPSSLSRRASCRPDRPARPWTGT